MKKFWKIVALLCVAAMILVCGTACTTEDKKDDKKTENKEAEVVETKDSDLEYVQGKGKLVVGITDFAPMDYEDADGNWIGFDADMAKAFAESLGVEVEFVEINWGNKIMELDGKSIDCVWNGMTLTEEVRSGMETSEPYCLNAQVVVVKKDVADKYKTIDSLKNLNFAVEGGSAGEEQAIENAFDYTSLDAQNDTLMEVSSGTSDASIIDLLMAGAMIGEGTGYEDLTYTVALNEEEYGVGFRKGSDLAEKLNAFFDASYADGSMMKIAEKYGVQESIIER